MKGFILYMAVTAGVLGLAGCSTNNGPALSCSFESAQATLPDLIWKKIGNQFSADTPSLVDGYLETTRRHFKLVLTDTTTLSATKETNQVNCAVKVTSVLQDAFKTDSSQLDLDGQNLTGTVQYHVMYSDDHKTSHVEVVDLDTSIRQLAGIGRAIFNRELETNVQ
ncbi:MAG: hypothetical protein P4L87_04675 [Formivibrio sp.]|nr:hypothetical protein [Formivibrio sp.]